MQTPWRQYRRVLAQFIRKIESISKNGKNKNQEANCIHRVHTTEQLTEVDSKSINTKDMR